MIILEKCIPFEFALVFRTSSFQLLGQEAEQMSSKSARLIVDTFPAFQEPIPSIRTDLRHRFPAQAYLKSNRINA